MSLIWNDCLLIAKNGEIVEDLDSHMFASYKKYNSLIRRIPTLNVWYDMNEQVCFGEEADFYTNPREFAFFSERKYFFSNPSWGEQHVSNYLSKPLGNATKKSTDYIIHDHEGYKKYENKNILIVGAGPSTIDIDWKNIDTDHDYVWSCNNFFMNDELSNMKISLAALGPNVDLKNEKLLNCLRENETLSVFEGGISPFRKHDELVNFKNMFPNNVSYFHTRYFGKIGTVSRLICLATFLGAKRVSFIGMDGYPIGYNHAFEGESKKHQGSPLTKNSFNIHRRQYVLLWDYLLNGTGMNTEYQNLGEGHEANQTTDISKQMFPLNTGGKNE